MKGQHGTGQEPCALGRIRTSVADPECFDADPDNFFLLHNLTKFVRCNFLSNYAGGGASVMDMV